MSKKPFKRATKHRARCYRCNPGDNDNPNLREGNINTSDLNICLHTCDDGLKRCLLDEKLNFEKVKTFELSNFFDLTSKPKDKAQLKDYLKFKINDQEIKITLNFYKPSVAKRFLQPKEIVKSENEKNSKKKRPLARRYRKKPYYSN